MTRAFWTRLLDWVSGRQAIPEVNCFDREVVARASLIWQLVQPALQSSGRPRATEWTAEERGIVFGYIAAASAEIADRAAGSIPANLISIVAARVALQGQMLEHDIFIEFCRLEDAGDIAYREGLTVFANEHAERLNGLPAHGLASALLARNPGFR